MLSLLRFVRALLLGAHLWRDRLPQEDLKSHQSISIAREIERRKRQERFYRKGKRKRRQKLYYKRPKYSGTLARDHRFTNQRSLRRMYRNG